MHKGPTALKDLLDRCCHFSKPHNINKLWGFTSWYKAGQFYNRWHTGSNFLGGRRSNFMEIVAHCHEVSRLRVPHDVGESFTII